MAPVGAVRCDRFGGFPGSPRISRPLCRGNRGQATITAPSARWQAGLEVALTTQATIRGRRPEGGFQTWASGVQKPAAKQPELLAGALPC
jgi:hypothetical protein